VTYRNKLICLLSLTAVLALLYTGSFFFNNEKSNTRSASYRWLEPKHTEGIDRIVIRTEDTSFLDYDGHADERTVELVKKNSFWFVLHNGMEYPARRMRIEDFIDIFTRRSNWSVRAVSASSHERLGLDGTGSRVTVYGGNAVLLDLLFGSTDNTGREINIRRFAQNEVRSGENRVLAYVTGHINIWYNLRFFPESSDGTMDLDSLQRLTVYSDGELQYFSLRNREWIITGVIAEKPDQSIIENYLRIVLASEGDNFADPALLGETNFNHSRLVFEFGNGQIITVHFSEPDETGRSLAYVSGKEYVYSVPSWTLSRIFRKASSFERQN